MKEKMITLRELIKLNSEYIKFYKLHLKKAATEEQVAKYNSLHSLLFNKSTYGVWSPNDKYIYNIRLYHVAYSLLRGRTYEQVERNVKEQNTLTKNDWNKIVQIQNQYAEVMSE